MINKKEYTQPKVEKINFDNEDIVTTSEFDVHGILQSDNYDSWF